MAFFQTVRQLLKTTRADELNLGDSVPSLTEDSLAAIRQSESGLTSTDELVRILDTQPVKKVLPKVMMLI